MVHRVMAWLRRRLLSVGMAAVRASGLRPCSRAVLLVLVSGEHVCLTNVRDTRIEDGWLLVVDAWGRIDRFRMETVERLRHCREVPSLPASTGDTLAVGMVEGA